MPRLWSALIRTVRDASPPVESWRKRPGWSVISLWQASSNGRTRDPYSRDQGSTLLRMAYMACGYSLARWEAESNAG